MHKLFPLLLCMLFALPLAAQEPLEDEPRAVPKPESPPKEIFTNFSLTLTSDHWLDAPDYLDVSNWRNRGISFAIYKPLIRGYNRFWLTTGLEFTSSNIFNYVEEWNVYDTTGQFNLLEIDPEKNKVSLNYLEVPLHVIVRLNKNKDQTWSLTLGAKGGILFDSHTKLKLEGGDTFKEKQLEAFNQWRYGVYGRIGYGRWHLYGYYALSTVLNEGPDFAARPDLAYPDMQALSVGVSFSKF